MCSNSNTPQTAVLGGLSLSELGIQYTRFLIGFGNEYKK